MDFPGIVLLSPSATLWTVTGAGLVSNPTSRTNVLRSNILLLQLVHFIFKQTETHRPFWLFILLLAIPACLTFLYLPHDGSIIQAAVKVFGLFWSTLTASILVYRVSPWHPLAKYPGPLICKLTKFHLAFLSLGGKQFLYYHELHRKYGDAVRVGQQIITLFIK